MKDETWTETEAAKRRAGWSRSQGIWFEMGVLFLCRLVLNTGRRFVYPFAPALARGTGVSLAAISSVIALNQASGLMGIFTGPLSDRVGYRLIMCSGLMLIGLAMILAYLFPVYTMIMLAIVLSGFGKSVFDPAFQAYIGQRVPFERRGLFVGMLETSWAATTLLAIPVIGLIMEHYQWHTPFLGIAIVGGISSGLLWWVMPPDQKSTTHSAMRWSDFNRAWKSISTQPPALGVLCFGFLMSASNDNLFVVYGAWLEGAFHMSLVGIGVGTIVIGIAELCGECLVAMLGDRLGLKKTMLLGVGATTISYLVLPFTQDSMVMAFCGLFAIFLAFEFSIVSCLSLNTELVPGFRATMVAAFFAVAGLGRVCGAIVGGWTWTLGGIEAVSILSAMASALAGISAYWCLRDWS